jgi:hypothetical protein
VLLIWIDGSLNLDCNLVCWIVINNPFSKLDFIKKVTFHTNNSMPAKQLNFGWVKNKLKTNEVSACYSLFFNNYANGSWIEIGLVLSIHYEKRLWIWIVNHHFLMDLDLKFKKNRIMQHPAKILL